MVLEQACEHLWLTEAIGKDNAKDNGELFLFIVLKSFQEQQQLQIQQQHQLFEKTLCM